LSSIPRTKQYLRWHWLGRIKQWVDPRTTPTLRKGQFIPLGVSSPNNPDVQWLQERSSTLKN